MVVLYLVGGFKHNVYIFHNGIILPVDELIFFRGVGIPPTSHITTMIAIIIIRKIIYKWNIAIYYGNNNPN